MCTMTFRRLPRGSTILGVAFLITFFFLFWSLPSGHNSPGRYDPRPRPKIYAADDASNPCPGEMRYLQGESLHLKDKILFSRRCIRPAFLGSVDRDEVVNISRPLILQKQVLDLSSCSGAAEVQPCEEVTLKVPKPYPERTYTDFIFGVSSFSGRLGDSVDTFATWLSGSGAKFIGIVADSDGASEEILDGLRKAFRDRGIDADFILPSRPGLGASKNHFAMVSNLVEAADHKTKWIGIVDDDTFFPSLYPLAQALGSLDHTKEHYAGALSEDFRAVRNWGYMAFGGAGMFLSVPAAKLVSENLDVCLKEGSNGEGDGLMRDCVYRHTHAKLTQIPGLYQQDMMGDVSGFFEGGFRPISLHHWKSWYRHPVSQMAAAAKVCGDCFLQRWRFGGDTVFTNGYSISVYKDGVEHLELDKTEGTWGEYQEYEFSLGPFRGRMEGDRRKRYVLAETATVEGGMRQVYVHRTEWDSQEPDEVVEVFWRLKAK
jgi:hypothetical protein